MEEHRPVQIVSEESNNFELNIEALKEILSEPKIQDLKVVILSIAGAFRKGKSFFLNLLLLYLESKYVKLEENDEWLGSEDEPLKGFSWRGGSERETNGILIWSKVFIANVDGEEIAIILMDTQGTFDKMSTTSDCATIFGLSSILSSIQIYNLQSNIQEDNLHYLQLFTEYGKLALEASGSTPFQKIMFLIRDWYFPYEKPFGLKGGQALLDQFLEINDNQKEESKLIRESLKLCFSNISCFLLPFPGVVALMDDKFNGKLSTLDKLFLDEVKQLVPLLLSPKNLVVKKINDKPILVKDFIPYFKGYMDIFKNENLLKPVTMFEATYRTFYSLAQEEAKKHYMKQMKERLTNEFFNSEQSLKAVHNTYSEEALKLFDVKKTIHSVELASSYREELEKELLIAFKHFEHFNWLKVDTHYMKLMNDSEATYKSLMSIKCNTEIYYLESSLNRVHAACSAITFEFFNSKATRGFKERRSYYTRCLERKISKEFKKFAEVNAKKSLEKVMEVVSTGVIGAGIGFLLRGRLR